MGCDHAEGFTAKKIDFLCGIMLPLWYYVTVKQTGFIGNEIPKRQ
ncbi:hypothetical protein UFOVP354_15 [uncultured Caudovirales phage]|uniref:Uncharacterized protein n=1 Tax=uncultured Caudovirales phage TaxID=2100421 RepID=A0A6J5M0U8_9CAUD|nr:hypothetical protein UFOVP354_15 [uncultured Caudovirales phage]